MVVIKFTATLLPGLTLGFTRLSALAKRFEPTFKKMKLGYEIPSLSVSVFICVSPTNNF
jgi:hypothetical protein